MSYPSDHNLEAARHALVLHDPDADYGQIDLALQWMDQSESNRIAIERAARFLDLCDDLAGPDTACEPFRRRSIMRWPIGWHSVAIAASLVVFLTTALVVWHGNFTGRPSVRQTVPLSYATETGRTRTIHLADGSAIALSGASSVKVLLDQHTRQIELEKGEALFSVAPDRTRPFVVKSGIGTTTAIGTAFNVQRRGEGATISVVHGVVAVRASGTSSPSETRIGRSMQVSYFEDGNMSPARRVDIETVLAWRDGRLVFSGTPLSEAVHDINRYSSRRIVLDDIRLGQIPISGSVQVKNITEWLIGLQETVDVTVVDNGAEIIIRRRGA